MTVYWIAGEAGACIVEQEELGHEQITLRALIDKSWELECNPGGAISIHSGMKPIAKKWFNRLLTKDDIEQIAKEVS